MRLRAFVLLPAMLVVSSLQAQQVWGSIRGRVVDDSSAVATAQIQVSSRDLLGTRTGLTDRSGYYAVQALPPGTYTVRIMRIGKRPVAIDSVSVQLGRTTSLGTTKMETNAIRLDEVRVTASHLSIDPTSTVHGATLTPEDYTLLPAARDYRLLIEILPDIVQSGRGDMLNANGATGNESTYYIDGMNVTDQLNAQWPTTLPYNVVKAVEVRTGGYEAQYGKALGAVVNATTYSGTNDFAVNVFGFTTPQTLSAQPRQTPAIRETNPLSYDVGVRVSGPVMRDRLWYSAAYNPRIWASDREITGLGVYRDHHIMNVFAAKASLRVNDATNLDLSVFGDPAMHHSVYAWSDFTPLNADPFLSLYEAGNTVAILRSTMERGGFLLETSAARSMGKSSTFGDSEAGQNEILVVDHVARTLSGGAGFWNRTDLTRSAFVAKGTVTWGRHTTVVGAEYEDVSAFRDFGWTGGYVLDKWADGFTTEVDKLTGTFHNRIPTAYVQNAWRVADAVSMNTGLRWSTQTFTDAAGQTAQRFGNEWQPRLGVVWQPGGTQKHRLYASFGRFYLQIPLNIATLVYVDRVALVSHYSTDPRLPGAVPDRVDDFGLRESDAPLRIPNVEVENADEVAVGYDRMIGTSLKLTTRAVRRDLRSSFQFGFDANGKMYLGTPGKGDFTFLPTPVRRYRALEVGAEGRAADVTMRASYLLSRSRGNFTGLYASDLGFASPGIPGPFMLPVHAINSTGLLPNDRTHLLKFSAWRRVKFGLTTGAFVTTHSGSPMNEFGSTPDGNAIFVQPRGSAGRAPWLWNLNLRLVKEMRFAAYTRSRATLDLLNVGNPQRPTWLTEEKWIYRGSMTPALNPNYGKPRSYQDPMALRLGMEVEF